MNAQDMIAASQLTRSRELQTQLLKAAAENRRLAEENAELKAHLDLAILAAEDLRTLPEGGTLVIADAWNLILGARAGGELLGSTRQPHDPPALIVQAREYLDSHPLDFVWLVFDGPRENARVEGRLRISYTGGVGAHRADKFICDFLRMAKFRGSLDRIRVESRDRDFTKAVKRLISEDGGRQW